MKSRLRSTIFFLALIFSAEIMPDSGIAEEKKEEILKIGNLALPLSQLPAPLLSFGQNIVGEGDFLGFTYPAYIKGHHKKFSEILTGFVYGIRGDLSLFAYIPVATRFKLDNQCSSGIEDMVVQLEYAYYLAYSHTSINLATIVGNITLPSGSLDKAVPTGFGSPTFLLGFTGVHLDIDWYCFVSLGAQFPTMSDNILSGKRFLYQGGVGRNISYATDRYIFSWLLEFDGTYYQRDKILGIPDPDSGGNSILLGPSLFFSTQHLIAHAGISWVISQHLFGLQNKNKYVVAAVIAWKFNS